MARRPPDERVVRRDAGGERKHPAAFRGEPRIRPGLRRVRVHLLLVWDRGSRGGGDGRRAPMRLRKRMKPAAPLIVALLASEAGPGGERSAAAEAPSGFAGRWVAKRLSVGARVTCFRLEDTRRASENGYDNTNVEGRSTGPTTTSASSRLETVTSRSAGCRRTSSAAIATERVSRPTRAWAWAGTGPASSSRPGGPPPDGASWWRTRTVGSSPWAAASP